MKKSILFLLLFFSAFLSAQEEFSFQLYFEDAAGNKDTITLGYDPLATDGIDVAFGEANILNQPWGDSLDVRIGDKMYTGDPDPLIWLAENTYQAKKQILASYCDNWNKRSEIISIQFKTKSLPVTIKWNGDFFNDTCRDYSCFFGTSPDVIAPPDAFWGVPSFGTPDGFTIDKYEEYGNEQFYIFIYGQPSHNIQYFIENTDSIGIFKFMFWGHDKEVKTNNKDNIRNFQFYPNPSTDLMTIDLSDNWNNEPYELTIYQLDGTLMKKQALSSDINTISVNELNRGIYFFTLTDNAGTTVTQKIMKN